MICTGHPAHKMVIARLVRCRYVHTNRHYTQDISFLDRNEKQPTTGSNPYLHAFGDGVLVFCAHSFDLLLELQPRASMHPNQHDMGRRIACEGGCRQATGAVTATWCERLVVSENAAP